jgi:sulfur-carrier protein
VTVKLRLFAQARQAAGRTSDELEASTLGELLAAASAAYGPEFAAVLGTAKVWVNGEDPPQGPDTPLGSGDEVAVLPPVSGGG